MSVDAQAQLAALESLDRPELARRWATAFGCAAPQRCGATLLRLALGWHVQMQASGVRPSARPAKRASGSSTLRPGTRLLREWQGRTYEVIVTASGFEYASQPYRSLSSIARHITGTAWSGPFFFGLR